MARISLVRIQALALSALLLLATLALIGYARQSGWSNEQQLVVRQLDIGSLPLPPPPPPPAPAQTSPAAPALDLPLASADVSFIAPPDIVSTAIDMHLEVPPLQMQPAHWQALELDISALSLNQLDALPQLQTPLNATFPRKLSRRGVTTVLVKLDVLIDEQGRLTLLDIVENPYPELEHEIARLVRSSRFSAPQQDGQSVSARFIWPVEFKP